MVELKLLEYGYFALSFYYKRELVGGELSSLPGKMMLDWLQENFDKGSYKIDLYDSRLFPHTWGVIYFKNEEDVMAFKIMFPEACE